MIRGVSFYHQTTIVLTLPPLFHLMAECVVSRTYNLNDVQGYFLGRTLTEQDVDFIHVYFCKTTDSHPLGPDRFTPLNT